MNYEIVYAPEVGRDLARIAAHLETYEVADVEERMIALLRSIETLEVSPYLGRPVLNRRGRRELIIGKRSRGHIVRYSIEEATRTVLALGIRGQRERGFTRVRRPRRIS